MPNLITFDLETFLIGPGQASPPAVCGSFATETGAWLVSADVAFSRLAALIQTDPTILVGGANLAFDFAVTMADRPDLIPLVFDLYDRSGKLGEGGVFDLCIAQALNDIAQGRLLQDLDGTPLRSMKSDGTFGKRTNRYSLANVLRLLTGRIDAKANDHYRLRYGTLAGIPIEQWPPEARQYPVDDAHNSLDCVKVQHSRAALPHGAESRFFGCGEVWQFIPTKDPATAKRFGWTHQIHQARAALAMQLAATWGLRTDPVAVAELSRVAKAEYDSTIELLNQHGLAKQDGEELKKDSAAVKARVAIAYGTDPLSVCPVCNGSKKVPSPKTKKPIQCKACSATGLEIGPAVPRTPADGIKADRMTLEESADPVLESLADADAKTWQTYVPFLQRATQHPETIDFNAVLETGRASWGILQTLPKKPGVRECVIPERGHKFVSVDYSALEFATFGQVALWVVGYSKIVEVLNTGKDPHSILGARMIGRTYEEFIAGLADPKTKDTFKSYRFGTKAGNFGFGGLMGPVRFAQTQRRQKPFPYLDGRPAFHGSLCRILGREVERGCNTDQIFTWAKRPIAPTCRQCVEVALELKNGWLGTWEEAQPYFDWITSLPGVDDGHGLIVSPGSGWLRGELNASEAANHPFQHLASMGAKRALWNVTKEMYDRRLDSPLFGSRVLVFAHDEIVAQVPDALAHEASHRLADVMIASMREFVPDVLIKAEPALMDRWYKKAEPVYDSKGRLIPWQPK